MTNQATDQLFRQAAEAEGGMSVSAGARVAHVRLALESGRAVTVDLSPVPEDLRSSLIELIRDMVTLTAAGSSKAVSKPTAESSNPVRPT
jgi:hypothetical protein